MINNKYKGDDSTSKDSVNTTSTDQKQINSREDSRRYIVRNRRYSAIRLPRAQPANIFRPSEF
jgi:hypothetical protein